MLSSIWFWIFVCIALVLYGVVMTIRNKNGNDYITISTRRVNELESDVRKWSSKLDTQTKKYETLYRVHTERVVKPRLTKFLQSLRAHLKSGDAGMPKDQALELIQVLTPLVGMGFDEEISNLVRSKAVELLVDNSKIVIAFTGTPGNGVVTLTWNGLEYPFCAST